MRAIITKGGFPTFINIRENEFINKYFSETELLEKSTLTEREQHIAQTLTSRGVLDKVVNGESISFKLNINNYGRA